MSKERCDHNEKWRVIGRQCKGAPPQFATDLHCSGCGEYWWRPFYEGEKSVFGSWVVIREGEVKAPSLSGEREEIYLGTPLDSETKEKLEEIFVRGNIYEFLHWGGKGLPRRIRLLHLNPEETKILVDNVLLTKKQMEVLKHKLGTKINQPLTTSETASALGISYSAVYTRETYILGRLTTFLEATRDPEVEVFFLSRGPNQEPAIDVNRPHRPLRELPSVLGKWKMDSNLP